MTHNVGGILETSSQVVGQTFGNTTFGNLLSGGLAIASSFFGGRSPPGRNTTPPATPQVGAASQTSPVAGSNITRGFRPAPFRSGTQRFARATNVASLAGVGRGLVTGAAGGIIGEGLSRMFGGGDNNVSQILREARENINGPVTKNKIIDAAKFCGIETAANTFGLNESQVCLVIVAGRTRRRRGISAADIRRTKRVIRFNKRLTKDLRTR